MSNTLCTITFAYEDILDWDLYDGITLCELLMDLAYDMWREETYKETEDPPYHRWTGTVKVVPEGYLVTLKLEKEDKDYDIFAKEENE